jgi:hypothetical protein
LGGIALLLLLGPLVFDAWIGEAHALFTSLPGL